MPKLEDRVKKIASDLANLEVNTIIKSNIIGTKMPDPRHALMDIAKTFDRELTRQRIGQLESHNDYGGRIAFKQLGERAASRITNLEEKESKLTGEDSANLLKLYRIQEKSAHIEGLFNSVEKRGENKWEKDKGWNKGFRRYEIEEDQPSLTLTPDELVLIRKTWELGMEEIAMQTIIQLDGDVVTRIQPNYASSDYEVIHRLHNQSVSISVAFWKELVGILSDFFTSIVKTFFKKL